jgi:hypothetical protein
MMVVEGTAWLENQTPTNVATCSARRPQRSPALRLPDLRSVWTQPNICREMAAVE